MPLTVCLAGATGWAGSELARGIAAADDLMLVSAIGQVRPPALAVPVEDTVGAREARGTNLGGAQVHSARLPDFVIGVEAIFGMPDQTLSLRHNAGSSAKPYVDGALLAIRKVGTLVGVHRGLDAVMDL